MSRVRRVLPCVLGGLLVLSGTAGCASAPTELKLTVSGETSLLHYSPGGSPRPLVVVLHGLGSDGAEMSRVTGLSRFADRNGFSVVYPNARRVVVPPSPAPSPTATPAPTPTPTPTTTPTPAETSPSPSETPSSPEPQPSVDVGETPADLLRAQRAALTRSVNEVVANEPSTSRAWNAGPCCGGATADDVTYLRRVVAAVTAKVPVDRHRIYVVGLSNGGMMATRAICDAPDLFAAAGTVAGPYLGTRCGRPVWKHLHGGLDPIVPYLGGASPGVPTLGVAVDWCRCVFPSSATEAARLRGYISTTYVPTGTHSWPTLSGPWHLDGNAVLWKAISAFRR